MTAFEIPARVVARARVDCASITDSITELGGQPVEIDADELITGRSALLGLGAPTRISCGGASQLLEGVDGWCALTLSRPADVDAVPALLEDDSASADPWESLTAAVALRRVGDVVARARLLDIPAAVLGEVRAAEPIITVGQTGANRPLHEVLVVDMSSMWAGPLCGRLLASAGATVVKVESPGRPDGTRGGHAGFFDWVNSEKLVFAAPFGSGELAPLLRAADVVIEGSRPAALARNGLGPDVIPARPGRIWLRISGYGSSHPQRVAFGDDAAVAGGLVVESGTGPMFCADAIADPLTGITATAAVLAALGTGGGAVIDVSLAAVAASYAQATGPDGMLTLEARAPVLPVIPAGPLGADNDRVRTMVEKRLAAC
ncbi:MAG: CoA transferase [Mycobacterium sp.]